jgi:hypothetical protein
MKTSSLVYEAEADRRKHQKSNYFFGKFILKHDIFFL